MCVYMCVLRVRVSCVTREERWTGDEEGDEAIEPEWYLSLNVRAHLFEQGIHLKDVLMLNEQAGENAD